MSSNDRSTGKEVNENVKRSFENLFLKRPFKADGDERGDNFNPQPVSWNYIKNLKEQSESLGKTVFSLKKEKGGFPIGTIVVEVGQSTGFPKKVKPRGKNKPIDVKRDEVESIKPAELTVEDVFELILKPQLDHDFGHPAKKIPVETLRKEDLGEPYAGAYVIVSRKMLMLELCAVLSKYVAAIVDCSKSFSPGDKSGLVKVADKDFYFWLDIFSMHMEDGEVEESSLDLAERNVPLFNEHLVVFDSHVSPTVMMRFWSIWEMYCLVKAKKDFRILFFSNEGLQVEFEFIKAALNEIPASLSLYPCFYVALADTRQIQNSVEKSMNGNSDRTDGDPDDDGYGGSFSTKDFTLFSFIDAIDVRNLDNNKLPKEYRVKIGQLEGGFKGVKKVISLGIKQAIYSEFDKTYKLLLDSDLGGLEHVSIIRRCAYFYKSVGRLQIGKEMLSQAIRLVGKYKKLPAHDRVMSGQMAVLLFIDLAMFELSKGDDDDRHLGLSLLESSQPLNLEEVQNNIADAVRCMKLLSVEVLVRKMFNLAMQRKEFQKFYDALCKEVDENEGQFQTMLIIELASKHLGRESDAFIEEARPGLDEYNRELVKTATFKNPTLLARLHLANSMYFKAKFNQAKGNPSSKESPKELFEKYCEYLKSAISCLEEHTEESTSKHHFTAACYRLELGKFYFKDEKEWGKAEIEFQVAKENIEYHAGISGGNSIGAANKFSALAEIHYFLGEIRTKLGYFNEGVKHLRLALEDISLFKYGSSDLEAAARLALSTCMQGTDPAGAGQERNTALSLLTDNRGNRSVLQLVPTSSSSKEIVIDAEI